MPKKILLNHKKKKLSDYLNILPDFDVPEYVDKSKLVVFAGCDAVYFKKYALYLARSIAKNSSNTTLHYHIVNPDEETHKIIDYMRDELPMELVTSFEQFDVQDRNDDFIRTYYASIRFIRLYQILQRNKNDIITLDVDCLVRGDLNAIKAKLADSDAQCAIHTRFDEKKKGLKVAIGLLFTKSGFASSTLLTYFIYKLLKDITGKKAKWFLDQIAFYQAYIASGKPELFHIDRQILDWDFNKNSMIWTGKGKRKDDDDTYLAYLSSFEDANAYRKDTPQKNVLEIKIFLPQLDLPFKKPAKPETEQQMRARREGDTGRLRKYWSDFTSMLCDSYNEAGHNCEIITLPMWEITPQKVNSYSPDIAVIAHKNYFQFSGVSCKCLYYMQVIFPWLFTLDERGWSAGNSKYPVDFSSGDENSSIYDEYKKILSEKNLSKFRQLERKSRAALIDAGEIPDGEYIFFPCQIPHDQSIKFFSPYEEIDVVKALADWAKEAGVCVVFKAHPVNIASCKEMMEVVQGEGIYWSNASIHDLISNAKAVYTMNSGVGFEAIFYNKPVVTFANVEYDAVTIHAIPEELDVAWNKISSYDEETQLLIYKKFVDFYTGQFCIDTRSKGSFKKEIMKHLQA